MSPSDRLEPTDAARRPAPSSVRFRIVFGLYAGVLVAGLVTAAAALGTASTAALVGVSLTGFATGSLVGIVTARIDERLPIRLGRNRRRRVAAYAPAAPFGAAAVASWWFSLESAFGLVTTGSAFGLLVTGYVVAALARTRYADDVALGEPTDSWRWTPPNAGTADGILAVLWLFLALSNVAGGNWTSAVAWFAVAAGWIVACVVEGRWETEWGVRPEIRVYENGLVERRPFTKSFVPWESVSHVRLRDDELILDRGFFDVRLERAELAELEAVRDAIERTRPDATGGNRAAD